MTKTHRLDPHTVDVNETATGQSGFVADPAKRRVIEPDEHYPHLPETSYHHDKDATAEHSPGPFHGDDLVSQQRSGADIPHGGHMPNSYIYDNETNTELASQVADEFTPEHAVPVRIVDSEVKERRVTHDVGMPMSVTPGATVRVLGKDPTRVRALISAAIASADGSIIMVQSNGAGLTGIAKATTAQFGFPIGPTPIEILSEEEIWVYAATDAAAMVYINSYSEYARSANTRAEFYDG